MICRMFSLCRRMKEDRIQFTLKSNSATAKPRATNKNIVTIFYPASAAASRSLCSRFCTSETQNTKQTKNRWDFFFFLCLKIKGISFYGYKSALDNWTLDNWTFWQLNFLRDEHLATEFFASWFFDKNKIRSQKNQMSNVQLSKSSVV